MLFQNGSYQTVSLPNPIKHKHTFSFSNDHGIEFIFLFSEAPIFIETANSTKNHLENGEILQL